MKPTLSFTALLLSSIIFCQEKIELEPSDLQLLDSLAEAHFRETESPGMAVGIVAHGKILYAKGFGVKNLKTKDPVDTKSVFHMASISKTFVATAIAQLVEEHKINLEDPVTKYLPYFKLKDEQYKDITVKQMVTHTSGIPDVIFYNWKNPEYDDDALENYVKGLKKKGLNFTPGEKYKYSNTAFNILADVIAKASGMTFEDYMKNQILLPTGMENSSFYKPDISDDLATSPHVKRPGIKVSKVYPYNRVHAGSSTLNSNVEDMMRYAVMYLNKGTINGNEIFSKASYDLITTEHVKRSETSSIGLSWFITNNQWFNGRLDHSGGDTGYRTWLGIVPEKSWAMVVLYNCDWNMPNSDALFEAAYFMSPKYK